MQRHRYGNEKHQSAIKRESTRVEWKNAHGFDVIQPECAEKEQRPAAADAGTAKQAIAFVLFKINSPNKEKRPGKVRDANLAKRSKSAELVDPEQSDAYDENDDPEFVEPVRAQGFFDCGDGFHALLESGLRRCHTVGGEWRWR